LGNLIHEVDGDIVTEYTHNNRNQLVEKVIDGAERRIMTGRVEYDEWGKPNVITPGLEPNYTGAVNRFLAPH
ncbi:MAG: hypothetical protein LBS84_03220, partial [Clostridiales bacterium]|nr:hypothetical protein [Clostridiales bacterium]